MGRKSKVDPGPRVVVVFAVGAQRAQVRERRVWQGILENLPHYADPSHTPSTPRSTLPRRKELTIIKPSQQTSFPDLSPPRLPSVLNPQKFSHCLNIPFLHQSQSPTPACTINCPSTAREASFTFTPLFPLGRHS